jgi:hypothetical protein
MVKNICGMNSKILTNTSLLDAIRETRDSKEIQANPISRASGFQLTGKISSPPGNNDSSGDNIGSSA